MKSLAQRETRVNPLQNYENEEGRKKMTNQERVIEFMKTFGQEVKELPAWPDEKTLDLRINLIEEEVDELFDGVDRRDMKNVAKELVDILYVVYGMGASLGIDLDKCFKEVHHSNMSKLEDGKVLYSEAGKVLKGKDYFEPELASVLFTQYYTGQP